MYTNRVLPRNDFTPLAGLSTDEVIDQTLARFRVIVESRQQYFSEPMLPEPGGSEAEIDELESALGVRLPPGYRAFLRRARYAILGEGIRILGLAGRGEFSSQSPWLSQRHDPNVRFLVVGDYWRYSDGDQLLVPVDMQNPPVVCYLHEHGPLFEYLAPSFPAALWRIALEDTDV